MFLFLKRASYIDKEAHPSLLFQNYNIRSIIIIIIIIVVIIIIIIIIIRKQDWTDEDSMRQHEAASPGFM